MDAVTQTTDRVDDGSPKRGLVVAGCWFAFAAVCWIVRGTQFGWFMTPSLATVLGTADADLSGGSSENVIALEDPLLLAMAIAGLLLALFFAVVPSRRR